MTDKQKIYSFNKLWEDHSKLNDIFRMTVVQCEMLMLFINKDDEDSRKMKMRILDTISQLHFEAFVIFGMPAFKRLQEKQDE